MVFYFATFFIAQVSHYKIIIFYLHIKCLIHLAPCLTHRSHLINTCWIFEWMSLSDIPISPINQFYCYCLKWADVTSVTSVWHSNNFSGPSKFNWGPNSNSILWHRMQSIIYCRHSSTSHPGSHLPFHFSLSLWFCRYTVPQQNGILPLSKCTNLSILHMLFRPLQYSFSLCLISSASWNFLRHLSSQRSVSYINVSNQHMVYLKLTKYYVNYISI